MTIFAIYVLSFLMSYIRMQVVTGVQVVFGLNVEQLVQLESAMYTELV